MNYGPLIFLAALFALAGSWFGFVLTPQTQLGRMCETNSVMASGSALVSRPGLAREGAEVYRANGCAACHTEQVRQAGTTCDVLLRTAGTNQPATVAALISLDKNLTETTARQMLTGLPKPVLEGLTRSEADAAVKALNATSAHSELWIAPYGAEIKRGWGKRRSVAEDFLFDSTVMPGALRVGPDLSNIALRQPDASWHLAHLYAPRARVDGSVMPPYRFLFEKREIKGAASPLALTGLGADAPPAGYEIVPRHEAIALTAYLLSLRADQPLYDAPFTAPAAAPASTNAPAATNAAPATPEKSK